MEEALKRTYEAMPEPRSVLAVGDCGTCGGIFVANYATRGPISDVIPVDAVANGCPSNPLAILRGLLHITHHLTS